MTTDTTSGQLVLPFPDTDPIPTVDSQNWNATVCHRLQLDDGRVVYLHYVMTSYGQPVWTLELVTVDNPGGIESGRYRLVVEPWSNGEPDELPHWLRQLIQTTPEPAPVAVTA